MEILPKEVVECYASEAQQDILARLSKIQIIASNFFITGGTALSVFYLHHRISEDIDLFSHSFHNLNLMEMTLKRIFKKDLTIIQSSPEFHSYLIMDIKVDLVFDNLSTKKQRPMAKIMTGGDLFIDTLGDISSNKLCAATSRFEIKDIIDFYFISKEVWHGQNKKKYLECYKRAKEKEALLDDPAMAAYQIEESLKYALNEKERIIPSMMKSIDWGLFEKTLRYYIDITYDMEKWQ